MPKKEEIRRMFDGISPDYDRLNHLLSLNIDKTWRKRTLKYILPEEGEDPTDWQVLDVASGTGDFAIAIARRMKKKKIAGCVTGVDISEGMLDVMRHKMSREILDYGEHQVFIKAIQGDGENLPFPDNSFNRVTIAFGIRNFEDREKGLREFLRVLKPGGGLFVLELSTPDNKVLRGLYKLYFLHFLPWIGGLLSGKKAAYKYLPASVLKFPKPEDFVNTILKAGYRDAADMSYTFGICRLYVAVK